MVKYNVHVVSNTDSNDVVVASIEQFSDPSLSERHTGSTSNG